MLDTVMYFIYRYSLRRWALFFKDGVDGVACDFYLGMGRCPAREVALVLRSEVGILERRESRLDSSGL